MSTDNKRNKWLVPVGDPTKKLGIKMTSPQQVLADCRKINAITHAEYWDKYGGDNYGTAGQELKALKHEAKRKVSKMKGYLVDGVAVDLEFAIDCTGSMGYIIHAVKEALTALIELYENAEKVPLKDQTKWRIKPRIRLVLFRDYLEDPEDGIIVLDYLSAQEAKDHLADIVATGGGGNSGEDGFDALAILLGLEKEVPAEAFASQKQKGLNFGQDAGFSIKLLVTDEPPWPRNAPKLPQERGTRYDKLVPKIHRAMREWIERGASLNFFLAASDDRHNCRASWLQQLPVQSAHKINDIELMRSSDHLVEMLVGDGDIVAAALGEGEESLMSKAFSGLLETTVNQLALPETASGAPTKSTPKGAIAL